MAEIFGGSDNVKKIEHRELGYNIIEGEATIERLFIDYSVGGGVGYAGYVEIPISALNLGIQVPEVSCVHRTVTPVGGGIDQYDHRTLPYVLWDTNGAISEAAYLNVYYQAAVKEHPEDASSFLSLWYYNRLSQNGKDGFFYKIKASDATS